MSTPSKPISLAIDAASLMLVHCRCLENTQIFSFSGLAAVVSVPGAVSEVSLANACQALDIAAPNSNVRRDIVPCDNSLVILLSSYLQKFKEMAGRSTRDRWYHRDVYTNTDQTPNPVPIARLA